MSVGFELSLNWCKLITGKKWEFNEEGESVKTRTLTLSIRSRAFFRIFFGNGTMGSWENDMAIF